MASVTANNCAKRWYHVSCFVRTDSDPCRGDTVLSAANCAGSYDEKTKNARLASAAPQLLAALRLTRIRWKDDGPCWCGKGLLDGIGASDHSDVCKYCRAAIAAAEGGV